jgi:23S rRNA G2445 N2-methylase RlmL
LTLLARLQDPGFTPRIRELDELVDLLADEKLAKAAARAIGRLGPAAVERLLHRLEQARPPLRAHIVRAMGRFTGDARAVDALLAALGDGDPKTRRNAAIELGHVARPGVQQALLQAWERDPRPEMRRTIAASLGKVGSASVLPLLGDAAQAADPELARIAQRSRTMVERTASRPDRGRIDGSRAPASPVDVLVTARIGLEELLADELSRIPAVSQVRVVGPGQARVRLVGALADLFGARTLLSLRFPLPPEALAAGDDLAQAVARAATGVLARAIVGGWTVGPVRYRIAWADGAHKRAATWDAATAIRKAVPEFVNDPTASLWELVVALRGQEQVVVEASLAPRALDDPRFTWRLGDVPAASHPTIAAALARVAGVRPDDVVWDPFVGSGAELIERALLGPYKELYGTDSDRRALDVARTNAGAAGVAVSLEHGDALGPGPGGVTLIITNPPMGRRASRTPGTDAMLDRFVARAGEALAPGGRFVWIAPWPERARAAGAQAGLTLEWSRAVDMGGFDAEMQRWVRSAQG